MENNTLHQTNLNAINDSKEAENQVLENSSNRLSEQMSSENVNIASTISIASSSLDQVGNKNHLLFIICCC